jgi:hypothetical protein
MARAPLSTAAIAHMPLSMVIPHAFFTDPAEQALG